MLALRLCVMQVCMAHELMENCWCVTGLQNTVLLLLPSFCPTYARAASEPTYLPGPSGGAWAGPLPGPRPLPCRCSRPLAPAVTLTAGLPALAVTLARASPPMVVVMLVVVTVLLPLLRRLTVLPLAMQVAALLLLLYLLRVAPACR